MRIILRDNLIKMKNIITRLIILVLKKILQILSLVLTLMNLFLVNYLLVKHLPVKLKLFHILKKKGYSVSIIKLNSMIDFIVIMISY
jgi:hypothetical protein